MKEAEEEKKHWSMVNVVHFIIIVFNSRCVLGFRIYINKFDFTDYVFDNGSEVIDYERMGPGKLLVNFKITPAL